MVGFPEHLALAVQNAPISSPTTPMINDTIIRGLQMAAKRALIEVASWKDAASMKKTPPAPTRSNGLRCVS